MKEVSKSLGFNFQQYRTDMSRIPHGRLITEWNNTEDTIVAGGVLALGGTLGVAGSIAVGKMVEKLFGDNQAARIASTGIIVAGSVPSLLVGIAGVIIGGCSIHAYRIVSEEFTRRQREAVNQWPRS